MRHSKHLTLLVATLVALILVGVTYYLYLTTLTDSGQNIDDVTVVPEVEQEQIEQPLRDRSGYMETPERTPEEIEALRERLEIVETPERTPEEVEALRNRLESM